METKSAFLLQVLEKLAAPMVAAISEVSVRNSLIPDPSKPAAMRPEAEQVAGLLTKSTQLSIGLSGLVDLSKTETEADSVRLALTSLASPMMSNVYRLAGRTPNDSEVQRIVEAMAAVVQYSDGYSAAADANVRMAQIEADFFPSDESQVSILYMSALLPVVNSIMAILGLEAFVFGFAMPRAQQAINDLVDSSRRATVLSTANLAMSLGFIPLSQMLGYLSEEVSLFAGLIVYSFVLVVLAGIAKLITNKRRPL